MGRRRVRGKGRRAQARQTTPSRAAGHPSIRTEQREKTLDDKKVIPPEEHVSIDATQTANAISLLAHTPLPSLVVSMERRALADVSSSIP